MSDALNLARQHFTEGLGAFERGDLPQAERCFGQALAHAADRPSVLTNLGVVRTRLGKHGQAIPLLERAAALEAGNLEAWVHLGIARAELGQLTGAVAAFDRALALRSDLAQAWVQRGSALRELGRRDEAAASFERALACGADEELTRFYLAAVRASAAPDATPSQAGPPGPVPVPVPHAPPRQYVEGLFDGYADDFESHLLRLGYRAHERVVQQLQACSPAPWGSVLDLGCGTGLVGRLVRPQAQRAVGIDVALRMVEQSRQTGAYDEVVHADLGEWLAQPPASPQARHDAALAADVFIYVGAIDHVLRDLRLHLKPGGWLSFSVEALDDARGDFVVQDSLRYAHSEAYLRRLADAWGWTLHSVLRAPIRDDQRQPVPGMYVVMRAAGTP
ncbi:MAG: tetratricopeptide repeat protein [Burkholderiaceae bacterium]